MFFFFITESILTLILCFAYRFMLENKLYVQRKVKIHWILFGISILVWFISLFLPKIPSYILPFIDILYMCISLILYGGKTIKMVSEIIYSNGLTLTDIPDSPVCWNEVMSGEGNEGGKDLDKSERRKIKSKISTEKVIFGIPPVFLRVFKFRMSATANMKQYENALLELKSSFPEYVWSFIRDGRWGKILAYPSNCECETNFMELIEVSKNLPWYVIPAGVENQTTTLTKTNTMHVIKLHDTPEFNEQTFDLAVKRDGITMKEPIAPKMSKNLSYDEFLSTKEFESNMSMRCEKAGKNVLLLGQNFAYTALMHMLLHHVEIYVFNPSNDKQLYALNALHQVKAVAQDIKDSYEVMKNMMYMLTQRYKALNRMGMDHLPLYGSFSLGDNIALNKNIFAPNELIHVHMAGEERDIIAQNMQPGMEVVVEGDKRFRVPNHWEVATYDSINAGGNVELLPAFVLIGNYQTIIDDSTLNVEDEMAGIVSGGVAPEVMLNEIRLALETLVKFGSLVNIHLLFISEDINDKILPDSIMSDIEIRVIENADLAEKSILDKLVGDHKILGEEGKLVINTKIGASYVKPINGDILGTLKTLGVDQKTIEKVKKCHLENKKAHVLRFDRYDGFLPSDIPQGVKTDYGYMGEQRKKVKVVGDEINVAGRKMIVNESATIKQVKLELSLNGDLDEESKVGTGILPSIDTKDDQQYVNDSVLSMEEAIKQLEVKDKPKDEGRVDQEDGFVVVGDNTSLNSYYSPVMDDEDDPYHIIK